MLKIREPKDFWAGVMFFAFGVAAIVIGSAYPIGTAARMGPGYFPRILGILLIVLGAGLSLRSFRLQGRAITFGSFRPMLIVLGSVVLFGLLALSIGLVLATIMLIMVSSFASPEFRWKEALISSVVLSAVAVGAFLWGLGLQFPVWPTFIGGS